MHAAYYRPGGVYRDLPDAMPQYKASVVRNEKSIKQMNENRQGSLLDFIEDFTNRFPKYVDEYETLLTDNRIWKQRLVGIGVVSPERAKAMGFTGAMLRGSNGICARSSRMKFTICSTSISRSARTATATTVISCASRKCVSPIALSSNAWSGCAIIRAP
jgi:Ni,Fe-hydrogenase III large subunit